MGFWERQVEDLLTGIGELVGGGVSLSPPKPTPSPSPSPDPSTVLSPYPADKLPPPQPRGPWPPHIPEGQMDLSEGMPRSTLDKLDDDPDYVVWKPAFPGDLPPYWMKDYKPVGPENPNTWVRRGPDDDVPGETHPAGFSGATADAVNAVHELLVRSKDAIADTDQQLRQAVSHTHDAWARTRQRLIDIDGQIRSQVAALEPFMNSVTGQQQMTALLMAKTREVQSVVVGATRISQSQSTVVDGLGRRYDTIRSSGSV